MGGKLSKAPVYYTLAQVRFNPVWSIDQYSSAIQEAFRRRGYADARKETLATLELVGAAQQNPEIKPNVQQSTRYLYSNSEQNFGFVLHFNALTCHTTEYDVFDTFLDRFMDALETVHSIVGLDFSERVGVRYLDAIIPSGKKLAHEYLVGEIRGLRGKFPGRPLHTFFENSFATETHTVVSRALVLTGKVGFPPDLVPVPLVVAKQFAEADGEHCILDTDCFFERRQRFSLQNLRASLLSVQEQASSVFRQLVTAEALEEWK